MDGAPAVSDDQLKAPYAERWGLLKDVMEWLYLEQKPTLKLKEIVGVMQKHYQFYASETQYKRQFGLWNLKRALPKAKKEKISKALETRAQQGKSSVVLHKGKVASQKIRRYLKEKARHEILMGTSTGSTTVDIENLFGHALQCGNRVFINWNTPAAVLRFLKPKIIDHVSPNSARTPMSDIVVATPSSNMGLSPRNPHSPGSALSPKYEKSAMSVAVKESLKTNRAHIFAQKHHMDLLQGMNGQEQRTTINWLNQFWQFSFKTARHWGHGPRVWSASNLRFNEFPESGVESLPSSSSISIDTSQQHSHFQSPQYKSLNIPKPSSLCCWSIHVQQVSYKRVKSPLPAEDMTDPDDERPWKPWTTSVDIHDFVSRLQENLESNDFSTFKAENLPISSEQIARAAKRSPEQLMQEAFGFCIMARNTELIFDILCNIEEGVEIPLNDLYPLHLASSYLDGAGTCCGIFDLIVRKMSTGDSSVRNLYTNHLNHTVLDNLMIAILKGHTSCTPVMVDDAFKNEYRFAGEEIDICGRWDADSDCIRFLNASGKPTIPQTWKHMFCHTSAQTITHCIGTLFSPFWGPDINTSSGLFLKRCLNETCGLKLQLKPLHALIVTAVHLAQFGNDGETLFGMVACLLCLLGKGANPLLQANISLTALWSSDDSQQCSHSKLDPLELARNVPSGFISKWPEERRTGWKILCNILRLSQNEWDPSSAKPSSSASKDDFQNIYSAFIDDEDETNTIVDLPNMDIDVEIANNEESEDRDEDMADGEEYGSEDDSSEDNSSEDDGSEDDDAGVPGYCPDHDEYTPYQRNFFGKNKCLAALWAAVQTELLTYRRLTENDPWISENFDMKSVLESLEEGEDLSIGLVSKEMMRPFCRCGIFCDSDDPACLRVEEASKFYFSNLDDYSRTTFLDAYNDRVGVWGINY